MRATRTESTTLKFADSATTEIVANELQSRGVIKDVDYRGHTLTVAPPQSIIFLDDETGRKSGGVKIVWRNGCQITIAGLIDVIINSVPV